MRNTALIAMVALFALPVAASAHQHATLSIGGKEYDFVVGSLNEPIAVDDKTGVELQVVLAGHDEGGADDHHAASGAVTGLEETLKVELIAGNQKKVLDLTPTYGVPGAYKAAFYPTVATTLSYRFFGTIDGAPVDVTFACRPEGADAADEGEKDLGGGVMQHSRTGGFGCPVDKAAMGFPEKSASIADVASDAGSARTLGVVAVALSAAALAVSFRRRA